MLLVMDVGNTNITLGIFDREVLIGTFRMTTGLSRTSDEYGIFLCDLLEHKGASVDSIEDIVIGSVVPDIMYSLSSGIIKYFDKRPLIIDGRLDIGIAIKRMNPLTVGADRLIDAVAAYELYGGPVIVADFGTATTYDLVTGEGELAAAATAPGIKTSANAMWLTAAQLPKIEIKKPDTILADNTIASMQAGLVFGTIGQTEYIIRKIKEEAGCPEAKTVATGGLGRIIAEESEEIDIYDSQLTLTGMRLIYERINKKK